MVVIAKSALVKFGEKHPNALVPLMEWYDTVLLADWGHFMDIRMTFNSVDFVGNDRYVFNIKGNHYRLVALIHFSIRTVYVKFVGTHNEYDRIDVSTIDYKP
ncbi:mRNA interferase HigB [Runella defluvii]|uniref:mRNA interferase HigB n=2 Tax=Runella defluvii TaxID=370973 RepID=A0A7W5ZKI2_9BACT|nr:mRNA interferase HigB [Runella defluvii]